ncbi:MAG: hypothetical protein GYA51_11870, partial [Candidatus Methanofastidiosa archaeon]|nr:hypothetical protein [Candidatus Methanofastidiosa archaeon]
INLFLEIFGECDVFSENLVKIIDVPIKRLNWTILPEGRMPWERLHNKLKPLLDRLSPLKRPVAEWRLQTLKEYNPDFVAAGEAGFRGYVVYGFESQNLYIFESMYYGNATYVFDGNWEELSKKTKAEILDKNLQKERIIHLKEWKNEIDNLLNV